MKLPYRTGQKLRRGTAIVEMAAVVIIFLAFLFGILEYCRYLFVRQVMDNATREGARYAVVNTFSDNLEAETKAIVEQRLVGVQNGITNFEIALYKSDEKGQYAGPANGAEFGEFIVVQIDGDYQTIVPSFLFLNQTIHIRARSLMNSEAN